MGDDGNLWDFKYTVNLKTMFNFYGFFIGLGMLMGVLVVEKIQSRLSGVNDWQSAANIFPWALIPGIIGARFYHVIDYWQYYEKNPWQILAIWEGGLGIFGGIIGGVIGLAVFAKTQDLKSFKKYFLSLLDLGAVGLAIGQAIGRWGNFFNQELYGWPTNLPWGIFIKPENRLAGFEAFSHFHPLFLYESLGCLIIFIILLRAIRKRGGGVFFLYVFLYSFLRFWLEFLRIEGWEIKIGLQYIRITHIITVLGMLISMFALLKIFVTMRKARR
jgi:phosphatidylglycerol:prolipoprotein diacylglycerol transferase